MTVKDTIIKFSNVDFSYSEGIKVLEDVNFSISEGDFVCVVGPNGGGKTTLLKLILGLIKHSSGTIEILGTTPGNSQAQIGYVPQFSKFDANFPVSVKDVVLMGCLQKSFIWGHYSKEQLARADEVIEQTGLADFGKRVFSDLSGGQKQRALIARAMISNPRLLLLDEPTASVDIHGTEQFYQMFEEFNKKFTIVMVSHDIGFVSQRIKSVICVRKTLQIHPVSELTGETIKNLYGLNVHIIRHDHTCSEKGHTCPHS